MPSKREMKKRKVIKLAKQALECARPIVYYGFIPAVILCGMRTDPRPSWMDLLSVT